MLPNSFFNADNEEDLDGMSACKVVALPGASGTRGSGMVLVEQKAIGGMRAWVGYDRVKRGVYEYRNPPRPGSAAQPAARPVAGADRAAV